MKQPQIQQKRAFFSVKLKELTFYHSETKLEEAESVVNQVFGGNAIEMSRKMTTVFTEKCSRAMTNIDENEEHEKLSLPSKSLNVKNETLTETEIKEGELVVSQILDEIIGNALQMPRKN